MATILQGHQMKKMSEKFKVYRSTRASKVALGMSSCFRIYLKEFKLLTE